eukprot:1136325-Pelagomonas_calceolata.AAC.5
MAVVEVMQPAPCQEPSCKELLSFEGCGVPVGMQACALACARKSSNPWVRPAATRAKERKDCAVRLLTVCYFVLARCVIGVPYGARARLAILC